MFYTCSVANGGGSMYMNKICSLSFCGGGETCGSVSKLTGQNEKQLFSVNNRYTSNQYRPFMSLQFSNAFDYGAFGLIKNMAK